MNDCYLSLLLNFRALLSIDSGANLVNSKQAIGVILPDLSLLGYAVPVDQALYAFSLTATTAGGNDITSVIIRDIDNSRTELHPESLTCRIGNYIEKLFHTSPPSCVSSMTIHSS